MSSFGPNTDSPPFGLIIGEAFVDLISKQSADGRVFVPKFGGSPLNVAVGLSRLGTPVQLAATLAPGTFGAAMQEFCAAEGVDVRSLSSQVDRTFITVATPQDGHVQYEYFGDLASITAIYPIDPTRLAAATVVHASSTALIADPARSTVRLAYEGATGFKSLDPNPRPNLIDDRATYLREVSALFPLVDLVKMSDEDLAYLLPDVEPDESALRIHRAWGVTVIVTRASAPTILGFEDRLTTVAVPSIEIVDATGAGDSFTASLLADVAQYGAPADSAMWVAYIQRANEAAAATCQGTGGAESMPTAQSLHRGSPVAQEPSEGASRLL